MNGREFTGRTTSEAVSAGLQVLGLKEEQVAIEVVDPGSRGFLGLGGREARVLITPLPDPVEIVRTWLREMLSAAGSQADVGVEVQEGVVCASIEGAGLGALIGSRGRTLAALQYLLNLAVGKRTGGHRPVVLDIAGYRKKREARIRRLAMQAADRVRRTGYRVVLDPMPPAERRLVHLALHEMNDLDTHSEGEEPYRRVVVSAKQGLEL